MPKTYPKTRQKKSQLKQQPKPVNLLNHKSYWVILTAVTLAFGLFYGYVGKITVGREAIAISVVLALIGFAFYMGYKPQSYDKKATFVFVGASVAGFCIWAAMVLTFNATGIHQQIANSIGDNLFAITSLVFCLLAGAFIGDVIGKNRERISFLLTPN